MADNSVKTAIHTKNRVNSFNCLYAAHLEGRAALLPSKNTPSLRLAGAATMKIILIAMIRCYRYIFSAFVGKSCRFEPTCSHYAINAIEQHGCLHGCYLMTRRLLRCHPWHAGGYDPVP